MTLDDCWTCGHDFRRLHVETGRAIPTKDEADSRKCRDCRACHPPEDALVKEADRELVDA